MTVLSPAAAARTGVTAVVPFGDLRVALTTVGAVCDRRSPPPLHGILITGAPDGTLRLTGASTTATVSVRLPGAARSTGRVLVDGWALTRTCKALVRGENRRDSDHRPVLLDGSDPTAPTVTIGDYTIPLAGLPAQGHPGHCRPAPTIATVGRAAIRATLDRVLPAVGRDPMLPLLTGIGLSLAPGHLTVIASDRYRMAVESLLATVTAPATDLTLPGASLAACAQTWTAPSVTIGRHRAESTREPNRVTFTCGRTTASLVEIDGGPLSWRKLIETNTGAHTATFDRATVHAHVSTVAAILGAHPQVTDHIKIITWTVSPDGLRVAPALPTHGERVRTPLLPAATSVTDRAVRWAFNVAYVRDALAALPFGTVTFSGQSNDHKGVLFLSATGRTAGVPSYRHLLMPIRQH
ncbi:DNA polymerase III subunit beta [Frankia sp. AiPs1]|uniref:DNA polymerase III subunit beta family protein n=1 Tax=Frankia sp. AiPa1 TaxID=573492 RepID=UPI00202B89FE|nr:DNA polymerase III subunit beta [Frankia sp. AiPa1]MCL9758950.1 DNA polymerase III subunit beta [Frankia sp. AiPa1]